MVLKKDRTYRLCAVFTALNKIPKIQKHALCNLNAFSSSGCCCFLCLDIKDGHRQRRHLEGHPLQVRHKQDWARGFILLLPQATLLPGSDAGSNVVKPEPGFVVQNSQTSCSMWCPMYGARY